MYLRPFYYWPETLPPQAVTHYSNLVNDEAGNVVGEGLGGNGLFVIECVLPGPVISEYCGTRMKHRRAVEVPTRRGLTRQHEEYQLCVDGADVVIDGMDRSSDAKYVNHSCEPNARYLKIRLRDSDFYVVFIEAVVTIPASDDVLVDYGWSVSEGSELGVSESNARACKGYI